MVVSIGRFSLVSSSRYFIFGEFYVVSNVVRVVRVGLFTSAMLSRNIDRFSFSPRVLTRLLGPKLFLSSFI